MQTKTKALKERTSINSEFQEEFETLELFKLEYPFVIPQFSGIAISIIFGGLCDDCSSKEEVIERLIDVKNNPNKYKGKYKWKNFSLVDFFNLDYNDLIKYCMLKKD